MSYYSGRRTNQEEALNEGFSFSTFLKSRFKANIPDVAHLYQNPFVAKCYVPVVFWTYNLQSLRYISDKTESNSLHFGALTLRTLRGFVEKLPGKQLHHILDKPPQLHLL